MTGQKVGNAWHKQKGQDTVNGLERWLKENPNAADADKNMAQAILDDLRNALSGK